MPARFFTMGAGRLSLKHNTDTRLLHWWMRFHAVGSLSDTQSDEFELVGLAIAGASSPFCVIPVQSIDYRLAARRLAIGGLVSLWACNSLAQDWSKYNRSLTLSASATEQRYREIDNQGLTHDGTFDTEHGWLAGGTVQWRNQASADAAMPLWLQAKVEWQQGNTAYQGYLQNGSQLIPYSSSTGNAMKNAGMSAGWAVPLIDGQMQLVPYLGIAQRCWQRSLNQYGETYSYRNIGMGFLVQWQPAPRWILEVVHQWAHDLSAHLSISSSGFSADIGAGSPQYSAIELSYNLGANSGLYLQASHTRWRNGASSSANIFQAPPSATHQIALLTGIIFQY